MHIRKAALYAGAAAVSLSIVGTNARASVLPNGEAAQAAVPPGPAQGSGQDPAATSTGAPTAISQENPADIIVTANKRAERVLEVPGAITAFSGTTLLANGQTSIADIAQLTPGLQFNNNLGTGAPIVRGLTTGAETSPTVAIIVDGAPIGSSSSLNFGGAAALDLDPLDLQRVEVLKGPQGTLYGASTLGGLISYILQEPSLDRTQATFRAELATTKSGDPSYSVRGAVGTPLVANQLAARVSAYYDRAGGFVDAPLRGRDDANRRSNWGVHGTLLAQPTVQFRIKLDGFYQKVDADALDAVRYNLATRKPLDGDLVYRDFVLPSARKKIAVGLATVNYDLGFADLTSVTSYQDIRTTYVSNGTNSPLAVTLYGVLPRFGGVPFPSPPATSADRVIHSTKVTEEARLTSNGTGPFSWIVGGFYTHEKNDFVANIVGRTTSGAPVATLNPVFGLGLFSKLEEISGFGNATYKFSDRFDVTGGFRIGKINQEYFQTAFGPDAPVLNALLVLTGGKAIPPLAPTVETSTTVKSYLATARYHFSPDGILFARLATGFRPGGPNLAVNGLPITFNPDRTTNYEAGLKTGFLDGRGSIDITGYYTRWRDIIVAVSSGGIPGYTNGGDARVYGFESALNLRPTTALTLGATLAYSNGKITRGATSAVGTLSAGDRLPFNPRWTGSASADYRVPLNDTLYGHLGAVARFASSRSATFRGITANPSYLMPGYGLLDVRAGVETGAVTVDLFVRNVTDKRAQLSSNTTATFAEVYLQRPRTFGISITGRY